MLVAPPLPPPPCLPPDLLLLLASYFPYLVSVLEAGLLAVEVTTRLRPPPAVTQERRPGRERGGEGRRGEERGYFISKTIVDLLYFKIILKKEKKENYKPVLSIP